VYVCANECVSVNTGTHKLAYKLSAEKPIESSGEVGIYRRT